MRALIRLHAFRLYRQNLSGIVDISRLYSLVSLFEDSSSGTSYGNTRQITGFRLEQRSFLAISDLFAKSELHVH